MQKQFVFNLALIIILNTIIKPFYILGIDAEVQNQVGTAAYGSYFSLLNLTFLFNIVLDFGIVNYNTRNIAQHPKLIRSYFNKLLSIRFLLFGLYIFVALVMGFTLGYRGDEIYYLSILVFNQFIVAAIQFFRSNITALHWFKAEAFISVLDRFLLIIFCSVLLWSSVLEEGITIAWFIYAQTVAYSITAIACLIILSKQLNRFQFSFNLIYAKSIIKQSSPYALLIFLMFIYNRTDSIMLERLLPDGNIHAGIYAQGFRYLDAVNMFALLFAGLLLPIYSRLIKEKKPLINMVETPFRILIPISILVGVTCFFNSQTIIAWRYISFNDESSLAFSILILSFVPIATTYIFGTLLTANGSLKALNIMAIFGVFLNLILNLILIPKLQSYGAAIATLITQSLTAIVQIIIAYYIFKFRVNQKLLFSVLLYTLFIILLNYLPTTRLVDLSSINPTLIVVAKLIIGVLFLLVFRIFKLSHFLTILKPQNN